MEITDLFRYWTLFKAKPGGKWLFNRLVRFINPYTGALKANIIELEKGHAVLQLNDRRAIRNHLNSIHAIALTNLGEFTTGLALISQFTKNMRGIPTDIHIQFIKKARGILTAECRTVLPKIIDGCEHLVKTDIVDSDNEIVATISVKWKLGLINP